MDEKVKKAVETYQCLGCVCGSDITCYVKGFTLACDKHVPGTVISGIGTVFLGLPTGFNRIGPAREGMEIWMFGDMAEFTFDKFNVPVWKHLDEQDNTFVRGLMPRLNQPFLYIILEDCRSQLNCLEITNEDLKGMD